MSSAPGSLSAHRPSANLFFRRVSSSFEPLSDDLCASVKSQLCTRIDSDVYSQARWLAALDIIIYKGSKMSYCIDGKFEMAARVMESIGVFNYLQYDSRSQAGKGDSY